jgi:hypothetical protein
MNIYERVNDIINCSDLAECGIKIISFAKDALKLKDRRRALNIYYERMNESFLPDYSFSSDKEDYYLCDGVNAVGKYLLFSRPAIMTPTKTLQEFIKYGELISTSIIAPIGKVITRKRVIEIMNYVNQEYNFSKRVFTARKPIIAIMDYSKTDFNSETVMFESNNDIVIHFFLFHMKNDEKQKVHPETVFFHELGHALCEKYLYEHIDGMEYILFALKHFGFAELDKYDSGTQKEVIADILSVALMHGSAFEKYNPFPKMHIDDIKGYKVILSKLLQKDAE